MVMLCVHKHSIGACTEHHVGFEPREFVRAHVDLVLRGLVRQQAARGSVPQEPARGPGRHKAAARRSAA
jgi:hypothetical protein